MFKKTSDELNANEWGPTGVRWWYNTFNWFPVYAFLSFTGKCK